MNISPDGRSIRIISESEDLFLAEKSGAKSNIVRLIDADERRQLKQSKPKKIFIEFQNEIILRVITYIYLTDLPTNITFAVFSFTNEKLYHPLFDEKTPELNAKTMSPDKLSPVLLPLSLINDLDRHRRDRSHAEFISDLLDAYLMSSSDETAETSAETSQAVEEPSIDRRFVAITVSNGTLVLLQSIAHGRTLNMVIQELYEAYMFQRMAETKDEG